ncbi:MAG: protein kinase [Myxococcales bacterium]|nr:protein kinase [Myxococcales bacterium]
MGPAFGPGSVVAGGFRLDGVIGRGGMGTVYSATRDDGARAAVKVLHPALAIDRLVRARFEREREAARKVDHPAVLRVLGDGVGPRGEIYTVMELVEQGVTLKQRARDAGGTFGVPELLGILDRLLEALEAVHAAGVVHRDVKPDNILLTPSGALRLLDFGAARIMGMPPLVSSTGSGLSLVGTPGFLAPEQAAGRWQDTDARTDLFAAAALAVRLLTGHHVHEDTSVAGAWLKAAREQVAPVATLAPGLPVALAAVLDRALQFSPQRRWRTAEEMRRALFDLQAPTIAAPTEVDLPAATDPAVLVEAALANGDAHLAVSIGERAIEQLPVETLARSLALLAEAYMVVGRLEEGERWSGKALELAADEAAWLEAASVYALALSRMDRPNAMDLARGVVTRADERCARFAHRFVSLLSYCRRRNMRDLEAEILGKLERFVASAPDEPLVRASLHRAKSWIAYYEERFDLCLHHDLAAEAVLESRPLAWCRACLDVGIDLNALGAFAEAHGWIARGRMTAARLGDVLTEMEALQNLALAEMAQGEIDAAFEHASASLELSLSSRFRFAEDPSRAILGMVQVARGDLEDAERTLAESRERPLNRWFKVPILGNLARIALLRGDPGRAAEIAREALATSAAGPREGGLPEIELALVEAQLASGGLLEDGVVTLRRAGTRIRFKADRIEAPKYRATYLAIPVHARLLELEREHCGEA